jgi:DNA-binding GntR family transcriptional regulator
VLERIEAGDADGAAAAMRAHVQHTAMLLIAQEGGAGVEVDLGWTGSSD